MEYFTPWIFFPLECCDGYVGVRKYIKLVDGKIPIDICEQLHDLCHGG